MKIRFLNKKIKGGYITLLSVLIVGVVGVSIALSILFLGSGSTLNALSYQKMHQAKALSNACAEEALEQIRSNSSFSGSGNLSLGQGSCSYTVTLGSGQNRTIDTTGTVGTVIRKNQIAVTAINPLIVISTWQEI